MKGALRIDNNKFLVVEFEKEIVKKIYFSFHEEIEKDFPGKDSFLDYFSGKRVDFKDLKLDMKDIPRFYVKVYQLLRNLPYGRITNYENIAIKLGNKNLSRVVGNALKMNPFLIVIPCHRVVKKDGNIGNFSFGKNLKIWLLRMEGVVIENEKVYSHRYWWD